MQRTPHDQHLWSERPRGKTATSQLRPRSTAIREDTGHRFLLAACDRLGEDDLRLDVEISKAGGIIPQGHAFTLHLYDLEGLGDAGGAHLHRVPVHVSDGLLPP